MRRRSVKKVVGKSLVHHAFGASSLEPGLTCVRVDLDELVVESGVDPYRSTTDSSTRANSGTPKLAAATSRVDDTHPTRKLRITIAARAAATGSDETSGQYDGDWFHSSR